MGDEQLRQQIYRKILERKRPDKLSVDEQRYMANIDKQLSPKQAANKP